MSFGQTLWDQIQSVETYTKDGLDFLGQVQDFLKKRQTVEMEYSKAMSKLSEQYRHAAKDAAVSVMVAAAAGSSD